MNKKGDEKILIFYWIVIFVIIAVAVVSGVVMFFGEPLDVRDKEASLLVNKVIDCYTEKGFLQSSALNIVDSSSLEGTCLLKLSDASHDSYGERNGEYYIEVSISDVGYMMVAGNPDLKALCNVAVSSKGIPVCAEKNVLALDADGELRSIKISAGVNKVEQNAF